MLYFKVKKKLREVRTFRELDTEYAVSVYDVQPSDAEDSVTSPMLLCNCTDMKRGVMCRHFVKVAQELRFTEMCVASPMAAVQLYGSSNNAPSIAAQVWRVSDDLENPQAISTLHVRSFVEDDPTAMVLEPIGMVMPGETLYGVRRSVIEWASSLPYICDDLGCTSEFHVKDGSPFEDTKAHFDADTGSFDRLLLADLYMVYTTGRCFKCQLTDVPFDYDDAELTW